jgi:gamma-glutamylcyclotransferase (GGCT)/AIG2-like uncharacterized protein YtfP
VRPLRIFVYGTLLPGQPRWRHIQPFVTAWEPATVTGRLWDTGRGYPAARFTEQGDPVPGVLVSLASERTVDVIRLLDDIELEGVLFRRVEVLTSGGAAIGYEWLRSVEGFRDLPEGWRSPG